jgi:hypothetical protein
VINTKRHGKPNTGMILYDDCGDDVVDVQCAERVSAEDERHNYRMVELVH